MSAAKNQIYLLLKKDWHGELKNYFWTLLAVLFVEQCFCIFGEQHLPLYFASMGAAAILYEALKDESLPGRREYFSSLPVRPSTMVSEKLILWLIVLTVFFLFSIFLVVTGIDKSVPILFARLIKSEELLRKIIQSRYSFSLRLQGLSLAVGLSSFGVIAIASSLFKKSLRLYVFFFYPVTWALISLAMTELLHINATTPILLIWIGWAIFVNTIGIVLLNKKFYGRIS